MSPIAKKPAGPKVPPHNIDAEQTVLGAMMIDLNAVIKVVDVLVPDDFYLPVHQKIYQAALELYEKRQPVDVLSVTNKLKEQNLLADVGGSSYLAELTNQVTTASHIGHYAQIVKEKRVLRDLIRMATEVSEGAFEPNQEVENFLDEVEQKILAISRQSLPQNFIPLRDELQGAYQRIETLHERKGALRGVTTGFFGLDNILSGLQKSNLIVIGARPSLGKTTLALDIARQVAIKDKVPVGVFSLEMSREEVVDRFIAAESQVPLWRLRTGRITDDTEFQLIQAGLDRLSQVAIFVDDTPSPTINQMRAMARRLQMEHGLGLLIIDYLQLIQPRRNSDNMVSQVTEISRGLKGLARELNVPVLALSQLSRAVDQRDDKRPRLYDLRESGCVSGDTLLMRADTGELISIRSLAERVAQIPVPVFSLDEDMRLVVRPLVKAFRSGKKTVYALKLRSGKNIRASANHPFLTVKGWRRLDQLARGERIATPREYAPVAPPGNLSDSEIILLAHLVGDGCVLPRQPIHYTSADPENIAAVKVAARDLFHIKARLVRQKNWWHLYLPSPYPLSRRRKHPITNWYQTLGLSPVRAPEKILPASAFGLNNSQICLLLRHLWSTDGNISWKLAQGRHPDGAIYYSTTSPILAQQVQHLLLRLGIPSVIRVIPQKDYQPSRQVHTQGATAQIGFLESVGCFGERGQIVPSLLQEFKKVVPNPNLDTWPKSIWQTAVLPEKEKAGMSWRDVCSGLDTAYGGSTLFQTGLSRERLGRLAAVLDSPRLAMLAESQIIWDEIVSLTDVGEEEVFDATVPGTHNFLANDIIIHNSIEQDADVVIFIHRKDRHNENLPPEEQNMAEIMVAKHRNGPLGTVKLKFDSERVTFRSLDERRSGEADVFESF
ncbi:MAG: replicative DNA helicase [Candidatus Liptonbacteria bacterium]|nr:replicative DNA helicase [Candidatus Liptonbacteria bacterium]